MALPTVVSVGALANLTTAITVGLPTGWQENDIFVLLANTANQAFPAIPPSGWTAAPNQPTGFGTAGSAGGLRGYVWWRRATASESAPNIGDAGSYNIARMIAIRGCPTTGDPWDVTATSNQTTANTSISWDSITTTVANTLVLGALFGDRDAASTTDVGTVSNANLGSITDQMENWVVTGVGGGLYLFTGSKATASSTGASTASITSQVYSKWIGALKGESTQTLTQSSTFTNSASYYTQTVSPQAVSLTPSLYSGSSSYFTHTISSGGAEQTLTQLGGYDNDEVFYAPTATYTYQVTAPLYTDSDAFHAPTVTRGAVTLSPSLYTNTPAYYVPTVTRGTVTLSPSLYTGTQNFYVPTITRGAVTLTASLYSDADSFYTHTATVGSATLSPSLYSDSDTFHSPTVTRGTVTLVQTSSYGNTQNFYVHTVSGSTLTLSPDRYDSSQSYYSPTVQTGSVTLVAARYDDSDAFYSPSVTSDYQQVSPPFFVNGGASGYDGSLKLDIMTGRMVKLVSNKVAITF